MPGSSRRIVTRLVPHLLTSPPSETRGTSREWRRWGKEDMTAIYCGKRKGQRYEIMKVNSCHIPSLPFRHALSSHFTQLLRIPERSDGSGESVMGRNGRVRGSFPRLLLGLSPLNYSRSEPKVIGRHWGRILQITVYYKELLTINCQGTNHPRSILSFMDISIPAVAARMVMLSQGNDPKDFQK